MANSRYEYVKTYEFEDEIFLPNLIVVQIDGHDFRRFSKEHEFERPNDLQALSLMNKCAEQVLKEFPDIIFSYGFSDEYSFVFKKKTKFYKRRASKMESVIVSFFSSVYVVNWKESFPHKELRYPPSFRAKVISCAAIEVLQSYLLWRQNDCHTNNLLNTCQWELIKSGKTESEALELLEGTSKKEKNDLLFEKFGINYRYLNEIFRQGSCIIREHNENGSYVLNSGVHSKNIAGMNFWNRHKSLVNDLGSFAKDIGKVDPNFLRSFQFGERLMPSTWIVIRIDGCHFHRFSDVHEFVKPNDEQALKLMNKCAESVLKEFEDTVIAYGVSDEYSFVLKKDSQLYQRRASNIISAILSFFTSMYTMKWKDFFVEKDLKCPPYFDGRAVCYPSSEIVRDYLAWRQVDCHINNQYNTCFWQLVKSGESKRRAKVLLEGTQAPFKNKLLKHFGIEYSDLPDMFRQGSTIFREKGNIIMIKDNIIDPSFWFAHPTILNA